ncbi:MAG TPA: hypothetical protein PK020_17635 [Ilumatobacteraceae bacterium]|nr:hypothetical protein [Ilumatobacteraceae bacterium]HRB04802.1 hypothetical protein [Ilumatobacteraceae bacterium]
MTSASPDDLVVTFRSVPRRLREAQGDSPKAEFDHLCVELERLVGEAGRLMRTPADTSRIADAIAATPADAWPEVTLDELRGIALAIGHELRTIAAAGEP